MISMVQEPDGLIYARALVSVYLNDVGLAADQTERRAADLAFD